MLRLLHLFLVTPHVLYSDELFRPAKKAARARNVLYTSTMMSMLVDIYIIGDQKGPNGLSAKKSVYGVLILRLREVQNSCIVYFFTSQPYPHVRMYIIKCMYKRERLFIIDEYSIDILSPKASNSEKRGNFLDPDTSPPYPLSSYAFSNATV